MMQVPPPQDPRTAPFVLLRRLMPLEPAVGDRQLLHRADLKQAARK